jgi:hypothetical protein
MLGLPICARAALAQWQSEVGVKTVHAVAAVWVAAALRACDGDTVTSPGAAGTDAGFFDAATAIARDGGDDGGSVVLVDAATDAADGSIPIGTKIGDPCSPITTDFAKGGCVAPLVCEEDHSSPSLTRCTIKCFGGDPDCFAADAGFVRCVLAHPGDPGLPAYCSPH